jgi:hypothetical protein
MSYKLKMIDRFDEQQQTAAAEQQAEQDQGDDLGTTVPILRFTTEVISHLTLLLRRKSLNLCANPARHQVAPFSCLK